MGLFVNGRDLWALYWVYLFPRQIFASFSTTDPGQIYFQDSPPKNGEIALLLATNRGCVAKYVSQKWNESNDKSQ